MDAFIYAVEGTGDDGMTDIIEEFFAQNPYLDIEVLRLCLFAKEFNPVDMALGKALEKLRNCLITMSVEHRKKELLYKTFFLQPLEVMKRIIHWESKTQTKAADNKVITGLGRYTGRPDIPVHIVRDYGFLEELFQEHIESQDSLLLKKSLRKSTQLLKQRQLDIEAARKLQDTVPPSTSVIRGRRDADRGHGIESQEEEEQMVINHHTLGSELPFATRDTWQQLPPVSYKDAMSYTKGKGIKSVSLLEVTPQLLMKGFFELLQNPDYVHLYFDIDNIKGLIEWNELEKRMEYIARIFGPYSIGGYARDADIADRIGVVHRPEGTKNVSVHIVFYKTRISQDDMIKIMRQKDGRGVYDVPEEVDKAVYKLSTLQLFRHPCAPKFKDPNDVGNRVVAVELCKSLGSIRGNLPPWTLLVQTRGYEPVIEEADWACVFPLRAYALSGQEATELTTDGIQPLNPDKRAGGWGTDEENKNLSDVFLQAVAREDVQCVTREDIMYILSFIEPEYINVMVIVNALFRSPYSYSYVEGIVLEWYNKRAHSHGDKGVRDMLNRWYVPTISNMWLWTLLKHVPSNVAVQMKQKYNLYVKPLRMDEDFNSKSEASLQDFLRKVKLQVFDERHPKQVIAELKLILGLYGGDAYVKEISNKELRVVSYPFEEIVRILNTHTIWDGMKLGTFIRKNTDEFNYFGVGFGATVPAGYINLFQGWKYQRLRYDSSYPIKRFLMHIKYVLCAGDNDIYRFVMQWFANIVRNVTVKNKVMLIFHGCEGCGKTLITKTLCEVFGSLALGNVTNPESVWGKFNGLLETSVCINVNEVDHKHQTEHMTGVIKSLVTEVDQITQLKGKNARAARCWGNYLMTTNAFCPLVESVAARRFFHIEAAMFRDIKNVHFPLLLNDIYEDPETYTYRPEFMAALTHHLMHVVDMTGFNPKELITQMNSKHQCLYNPNLERQLASLNPSVRFFIKNFVAFRRGMPTSLFFRSHKAGKEQEETIEKLMVRTEVRHKYVTFKSQTDLKFEENLQKSVYLFPKLSPELMGYRELILYKLFQQGYKEGCDPPDDPIEGFTSENDEFRAGYLPKYPTDQIPQAFRSDARQESKKDGTFVWKKLMEGVIVGRDRPEEQDVFKGGIDQWLLNNLEE